jgi:hypothetical protein
MIHKIKTLIAVTVNKNREVLKKAELYCDASDEGKQDITDIFITKVRENCDQPIDKYKELDKDEL